MSKNRKRHLQRQREDVLRRDDHEKRHLITAKSRAICHQVETSAQLPITLSDAAGQSNSLLGYGRNLSTTQRAY